MNYRIAQVEKMERSGACFVERTLPDVGKIFVSVGDVVEPFSKVGETKVSFYVQRIDKNYHITKPINSFIEKGLNIATKKSGSHTKHLFAPYSGFIRKVGDEYLYEQVKETYELLSGVWGEVAGVLESKSVLLKFGATVVYGAVSTPFDAEGELVILPNPSELLEDPYFNNFTKQVGGKIIYSGHFIKLENLKRAINLGVRGIVAGGADKECFDYANRAGFQLMLLTGFGRIPTPTSLFNMLNSVTNRYVFVKGKSGQIIIPSDIKFGDQQPKKKNRDFLIQIKNDMIVQVLERPYFGWMGVVSGEESGKVLVKLMSSNEVVAIIPSNLIALAD